MGLKEQDRRVLVILELEKSDKTFAQMQAMLSNQIWELVANRLYYSLFHAVTALLLNDHHEVGTHRGAVNMFHLYYVKTGIFTKEDGRLYSQLQSLREDGDYNCSIDVEKEDVEQKVEPTRLLISRIKAYIKQGEG
ncbi:MAG: HEPN domain-containing protein [Prevotella sp.]|nr:HEPN domain-containing protein [Prevotella sp.]